MKSKFPIIFISLFIYVILNELKHDVHGAKTSRSNSKKNLTKNENQDAESGYSSGQASDSDNSEACNFRLNYDITKINEPVYLVKDKSNGNLKLAMPHLVVKDKLKYNKGIGAIEFKKGEDIYLACPGKKNKLENIPDNAIIKQPITGSDNDEFNAPVTKTECVSGTEVSLQNGKVTQYLQSTNLVCLHPTVANVVFSKAHKTCGDTNESRLLEIGFRVEGWHELIKVCHNLNEANTLYTTHTLYGTVLAGKVINNKRPNFSRGRKFLFKGFDPNIAYKKSSQHALLDNITGDADKYLTKLRFLARGHYAPDADFLFQSWQYLTYFYVNAAPQWQTINAGNWLGVENASRDKAMQLGEDLDVSTGGYGIMEIKNKDGKLVKLYLVPSTEPTEISRLPVPDYYWKALRRPKDNTCIVLISTNNPFLSEAPTPFCPDVCEISKWPTDFKDLEKGYVFCCEFKEFKKVVTYAPSFDCSGGILTGPNK